MALTGALVATLGGCPPPRPPPTDAGGDRPLGAHTSAGKTYVDVRESDTHPKLALVARQGDPSPSIVLSVSASVGAVGNAALAGLLESRLRPLGARVLHDGAGVRIVLAPSADVAEDVTSLIAALTTPVRAGDPALSFAAARVAALRTDPLDAPALSAVAACRADPKALASEARFDAARHASTLEGWRARALVIERMTLAVVGERTPIDAIADAIAASTGWPRGTPAPSGWPDAERHGAFADAALAPGAARLEIGYRLGDAVAAAAVARSLASGTLEAKLAASALPWTLSQVRAVSLPHGGCVSLSVTTSGGADAQALARAAADAEAVARREVTLALGDPRDAFVVTREIIGAPTAEETAARAAWWLSTANIDKPMLGASALAVAASERDDPRDGGLDEDALSGAYRQARAKRPAGADGPIASSRTLVEQGQGELWLLIANPCALAQEGAWDSGTTALAAAAAAASATHHDVTVEPWIQAGGAGVIAHGSLRRANENPRALARRVASAGARAFASLSLDPRAFASAKSRVLATHGGELGIAFATFAERASPERPSWIAPWGTPERQAATHFDDVVSRWRGVIGGPVRVAVLANVDEAQAALATRIVDRWLRSDALRDGQDSCLDGGAEAPRYGAHAFTGDDDGLATLVLGARIGPTAQDRAAAELTAAALSLDDGPVARVLLGSRWSIEVMGAHDAATLALVARGGAAALAAKEDALSSVFAGYAPTADDHLRAVAAYEARRARQRRHPRHRLEALWVGTRDTDPPTHAAWRAWLTAHLASGKLIAVSEAK